MLSFLWAYKDFFSLRRLNLAKVYLKCYGKVDT